MADPEPTNQRLVADQRRQHRHRGCCRKKDWCGAGCLVMLILGGFWVWWMLLDPPPKDVRIRSALQAQVNHAKYPHAFATNEWWQLMNSTAHLRGKKSCYACAHMPVSAASPGLWPYDTTENKAMCLMGLATHPGDGQLWFEANFAEPLHITWSRTPIRTNSINCSGQTDLLSWPQQEDPLPGLVMLTRLKAKQLPICVMGNGTNTVGNLPPHLCNTIYTFCPPIDLPGCVACLTDRSCDGPEERNRCASDLAWQMTTPKDSGQTKTYCSLIAPSPIGTRVLADWYWLCGNKAYPSLPAGWGGLCAIIMLSDHVFFLPGNITSYPHHRSKRDTKLRHTDVPYEFRLWGAGAKFGQSLIPWVGLGVVRDQVEISRYALLRHINLTMDLGHALATEQKQIREVVVQNRMVLDLLTAASGGVCKIIGDTCCTYIPDQSKEGGEIYLALQNLTELQKYVQDHTPGASLTSDWWASLFSGNWWQLLLKIATPVLGVLLLFCLFATCVVPCLMSMTRKMISNSFGRMEMMMLRREQPYIELAQKYTNEKDDVSNDQSPWLNTAA